MQEEYFLIRYKKIFHIWWKRDLFICDGKKIYSCMMQEGGPHIWGKDVLLLYEKTCTSHWWRNEQKLICEVWEANHLLRQDVHLIHDEKKISLYMTYGRGSHIWGKKMQLIYEIEDMLHIYEERRNNIYEKRRSNSYMRKGGARSEIIEQWIKLRQSFTFSHFPFFYIISWLQWIILFIFS